MAAALRKTPKSLTIFFLLRTPKSHHLFSNLATNPQFLPDDQIKTTPPIKKPLTALRSAIKSERDPDRIAALFQSSTHLPRFYHDRPLYQLTLHRLSRLRRPDLVEKILESQKSDPNAPKTEGFLIRLLTLYSASYLPDQALKTFYSIPNPSERSFCALLSALLDNNRLDILKDKFNSISTELNIVPGVWSYNIYLKALCRSGDVVNARNLLDKMLESDIVSYNTILDCYARLRDEAGFEELLRLIKTKGLEVNVVTYNLRIKMLCLKKESFKGEELLDVMVSKGVEANMTTFHTLIDGFCQEGDVDSAVRVFKRMREMKKVPGSDTYVVLIRSLVEKEEFGAAFGYCKECLVRRFAPPFEVVKGLVEGLVKNAKEGDAKEIVAKIDDVVRGDAVEAWKKLKAELPLSG